MSGELEETLKDGVRERRVEWALKVMDEISQRIKLDAEAKDLVREFRERRSRGCGSLVS
jgi:hypothetical protein